MTSEKGTGGIRLLQRFPRSGHLPRPGIQDGRKLDGRRQGRRRCGGKGILDRSGDRQGDPLDQRAGPDEALFGVLPLQGHARTVRFPGAVRAPLRRREVPRTGKPARIRPREVGPHVRGPAARNDGMALEQGLHRSGELVDLLPRTAFLRRRGRFGRQPPGHLSEARPRLPALRRGDRRQHRPSAPHARRRGAGGEYGRDLRLGSGLLPRRARILRQADHVRGTAAHALRDPLPEGDSGRNPQRGHRHQRRFRIAAGRLCRSRTAAAGAGPQFPEQPRGRHAAGVAPQHVLPLLDPARNTPGAHGHPQRPLQADLLLRRPARHDRLGRLRLDALVGVLRPPDRSAREPEPVRQPGLYGSDRSDETRDARTAPTIQGHRRRVGAHAGDHGDPLRPRKRKTLPVRIKKQNRT